MLFAVTAGAEWLINGTTAGDQQLFAESTRSVALAPNGTFVVTWSSAGQDGDGWGVYAQRYDSAGATLGGEFLVNTTTAGDQRNSAIAMDSSGNFVIVWSGQDGSGYGIYGRRYDAAGVAQGGEFLINTTTADDQHLASVAMDSDGDFVVVWASNNQDGSGWGIYGQRFDNAGVAQGGEFLVNTHTTDDQTAPAVAMDSSGNFVVAWQSNLQDGSSWGVYAQRYNAAGVAQGAEFRVNTTTSQFQRNPSVAMGPSGSFVIVWAGRDQGMTSGIFGQRYNAGGVAQGSEFQINQTTANEQDYPSVGMDASGRFVVAWASNAQDGDGYGIYARHYSAGGSALTGEFLVNTTTAGNQQYSTVGIDGNGNFVIAWSSAGQDGDGWGVYGQRYVEPAINVTPTSGLAVTEAGGTATFDVVLNSPPTANVTFTLASNDLTEGTISTGSLTFTPANWYIAQTVTVTGVNDDVDDGDITFTIVTNAASSADSNYNGMDAADVSVTNTDDDTAGITVTPTSGLVTTEAGGTAQFTVVLNSQPTANVTIPISSSNTAEGTVSTALLTFTAANWNTPQTVTVTGVNDWVDDGDIAYTIITGAASSADANYNGMNAADVSVTNTDDDTAGITVTPTSGLVTTEAGGTAQFTVVLDSQPTANVTIPVSSSNTAEGTVSTALLTFTAANWNTPQTVTVTGVNDYVIDGSIGYTIVLGAATSADANYNGMDPADVSASNTDDDVAGITVTPTSGLTTTEAGGTAQFTVVLTSQPAATVTIPVSSSNTAEGTVSTALLTFTAADWNVPQTVTVTGVNDWVDDGDIAYTVVLGAATSADGNYNGIDPSDVSVTNIDNDTAGITVTPTSGLSISEAGSSNGFSVVLDSQPLANVTIAIASSDTTEGTVSTSLLTFTPADWNVPQIVEVTAVDDDIVDGNITFTILTGAAASADPLYNGINPSDVTITNYDNDPVGTPRTGEINVNTYTNGEQRMFAESLQAVAMDGVGNFIVTWASKDQDGSNWGVYAQRYDRYGNAVGSEFRVNTYTTDEQRYSAVAMDHNGNFVIAWSSRNQDGSGWGIYAQRYNASGIAQGAEFRVNTYTTGDQIHPSIAMDHNGNFVITWSSNLQDGGGWGVYAQRYNAAGVAQGAEFRVNTYTTNDQRYSAVAMNATGDFVVTWASNGQDGSNWGVYAQRYNASGVAQGGEFRVNTSTTDEQRQPSIAMDDAGNFVIVWASKHPHNNDDGWGIFGQRFAADGTPVGGEFHPNTTTKKNQQYPTVAMDGDGDFVITWSSELGDGNRYGVYAREYAATGTARGGEFLVNTTKANDQLNSSVAMDESGDYVIAWTSNKQDEFTWGVAARVYEGGNDAPVNAVPGQQSLDEDTFIILSQANGNAISIADDDVFAGTMRVTLTASNGVLTLGDINGLTFLVGDGYADVSMVFTGTLDDINAALNGLTFTPTPDYAGTTSIQITVDDLGNFGWYGNQTDTDTIWFVVNPVQDAPVLDNTGDMVLTTIDEDDTNPAGDTVAAIILSAGGDRITDVDAGALEGIAVIGLTQISNGTWQYKLAGGSWTNMPAVSDTSALLLAPDASIRFVPNHDWNGTAAITFRAWDQTSGTNGQSGVDVSVNGGLTAFSTATETASITVNPVNDAPVATGSGGGFTFTENDSATIIDSAVTLLDVDDTHLESATVAILGYVAGEDVLAFVNQNGITGSWNPATGVLTLSGTATVAQYQAALRSVTYQNTSENPSTAARTVRMTVNDGELDSNSIDRAVTVVAVNDAPVLAVPGDQYTDEDTPLVLSALGGNGISISDLDHTGQSMRLTLSVANGVLTLGSTSGLTFVTGDGSADTTMVFTGTLADINAALDGLVFEPDPDFNGTVALTVIIDDQGNRGVGGSLEDAASITIDVAAVNDPPVNTVPGVQVMDEDGVLVFSTGNGNLISTHDLDVASGLLRVTLSVSHGVLTLSQTTGLTFLTGDGSADATLVFTGTQANVNAALAGLAYAPSPDYFGPDTLTVTVDDQGNTGSGGSLSDTDTVAITVNPVNDRPVASGSGGGITFVENDAPLIVDGAIELLDVDDTHLEGATIAILGYVAGEDVLAFVDQNGITGAWDPDSGVLTLMGTATVADYQAALRSITYANTSDYPHTTSRTIRFTVSDGELDSDAIQRQVTVVSINDATVNTVPPPQTIDEDNPLVFSVANGNSISVSDVDADQAELLVTLVATHGVLTLATSAGLTFLSGDGTSDRTMVFTGQQDAVNAALDGLRYMPDLNYNGAAAVTITVDDQGANGLGGPLGDSSTIAITINPVNDAPLGRNHQYGMRQGDVLIVDAGTGVLVGASDVDPDVLTAVLVDGPRFGTVQLRPDGSFVYSPASTAYGTDTFTYVVHDGTTDSQTFTVTITIQEVPPPPPEPPAPPPPPDEPPIEISLPPMEVEPPQSIIAEPPQASPAPVEPPNAYVPVPVEPPAAEPPPAEPPAAEPPPAEPPPAAQAVPPPVEPPPVEPPPAARVEPPRQPVEPAPIAVPDRPAVAVTSKALFQELDALADQMESGTRLANVSVGAAAGVTTLMSVGYVMWFARGGSLVASMLTTLPLWQWFDPLPVLDSRKKEARRDRREENEAEAQDEDEERLRRLVE